jgi:hypothetical protein
LDIIWLKSIQDTRKRRTKAQWQECYYKYFGKALNFQAAKGIESIQNEELEHESFKKTEFDSKDELYFSQR